MSTLVAAVFKNNFKQIFYLKYVVIKFLYHNVVIIIDISRNIWQQILYHIVVLKISMTNIKVLNDLCNQ